MKLLPWLIALALAFAGGYFSAHQQNEALRARWQLQLQQARNDAARESERRVASLEAAQQQREQEQIAARVALEKQLDDYRRRQPHRVALPALWRLQHNAAASRLPAAAASAGAVARAAGDTDDLAALDTVTHNYQRCLEWRDALIGWQQWYRLVTAGGS